MNTSAVPTLALPVEPYAAAVPQTTCDPVPKPGAITFRAFVLTELGGRDLGIERPCAQGGASEHKEGRAWDWGLNAGDPAERAQAEGLLAWLLAPDATGEEHAMFRRAGLQYMIWDHRIWSPRTRAWGPYGGESPHTDHVHFSFGWPGALGETSLYAWLRGEPVPLVPRARPAPARPSLWPALVALAGGALGWYAVRWTRAVMR